MRSIPKFSPASATTRERLDAGAWDYGYPFPQSWSIYERRLPPPS